MYLSCIRIYESLVVLGRETEGLGYLVEAHRYSSQRIEHILPLVRYYSVRGMYDTSMMYYTAMAQKTYESIGIQREAYNRALFINWMDNQFYFPYQVIIPALHAGRHDIAHTMFKTIWKTKILTPGDWCLNNLFINLEFLKIPDPSLDALQNLLEYCQALRDRGFQFSEKHNKNIAAYIDAHRPLLIAPIAQPQQIVTSATKPRIMLTVTTCKRMDLFEQTMNSILRTWTDFDAIDYFFCVDDNSSAEDRTRMKEFYPFFDFYMKGPEERGHRESMNIIWRRLNELKPTYWIHLEDDWLFFQRDTYVTKAMTFLDKYENQQIHQVLFNRNYAELYTDWGLQGGELLEPGFTVHVKDMACTGRNCAYWAHYSFRPSMIRAATVLALGNYDSPNAFFEGDYANRWTAAGYRSAFFNTIVSKHIGKLTSNKTGQNAYTLNDVPQFGGEAQMRFKSFVVNLERRPDRRAALEIEFARVGFHDYQMFTAVDGKDLTLTEEIRNMFRLNDFGGRRGVIGCAMSHWHLWKQLVDDKDADAYFIFEDDIQLTDTFMEKLQSAKQFLKGQKQAGILLGYTTRGKKQEVASTYPLDINDYIGGTFGYGITKQVAQTMLDHCASYGIRHGIDYQMVRTPKITWSSLYPPCVLSDWVSSNNTTVDSDIQRNWDSLFPFNPEDWIFIPAMDSHGYDIECVRRQDPHSLMRIATHTTGCVAFNTLGFLKHTIAPTLEVSRYFGEKDGIYIRKDSKKRIMMLCNWCDSRELCNEWNIMTQGNYTWNNLQLVWTEPADYYVIINKPPAGASYDPKRTVVFQMEPWCADPKQNWGVKTWGEWARPDPAKFLHVHTHERFCNVGSWQLNLTYKQLTDLNPEKTHGSIISSICSSKYFDPGHIKRVDFLRFMEAKADPDVRLHIYGKQNSHDFASYIGPAPDDNKQIGLVPYKYYFMCENNAERNYITEKLWEPLLTESLCFYWGCPNVADWIDPRAYVLLDMDDFESAFATVKQAIQEDWWSQRLPYIRAEKKRVLERYAFMPILENILTKQFNAQEKQDKFLEEHVFKGFVNGVFIDVGAHDGKTINNTLYFEKHNLWNGVNIEPIKSVYDKLIINRPFSININCAVSNTDGVSEFIFNSGYSEMLSGLKDTYDPRHYQRLDKETKKYGGTTEILHVPTKRLETICNEHAIKHIHYLTIDVEGAEFEVIKSINFDKVFIDVIGFENNYNDVTLPIIEYLERLNYTVIHKSIDVFMIHRQSQFIENITHKE